MKKNLLILVVLLLSIGAFGQKTNKLFEKQKLSLNLYPSLSSDISNNWGIETGLGYNIFRKIEIGFDFKYQKMAKFNYEGINLYTKYYFIDRKFTPFIEFDNYLGKTFNYDDKLIYAPTVLLGIGYYGIAKHLAVETGVYYSYPKTFGFAIRFKYFFY